jgi:hypothetical protein
VWRRAGLKKGEQFMKNIPKISYFQNKTWNEDISRTERIFCAELFFFLKEKGNLSKFIKKFENIITWKGIYGLYKKEIFNRADGIYGK